MRDPRSAAIVVLLVAALAACSRERPDARVSYGTAMADMGRRFELVGRAAAAGRYELAVYHLEEMGEQLEETLPHASPPHEGHPEVLPPMRAAFVQTNVPELKRALASRDKAQIAGAFERAAGACNACHKASGHGFIEIPTALGQSVPKMDPLTP